MELINLFALGILKTDKIDIASILKVHYVDVALTLRDPSYEFHHLL